MRSGIDAQGQENPKGHEDFNGRVKNGEDIQRLAIKRLKGLSFQVEYFVVYLQYALIVLRDKAHVENLSHYMMEEGYQHL